MINSTNTVHIDGVVLKDSDFVGAFTAHKDDKFSRWVVRPLAVLVAIGVGVAAMFASAFLVLLSLALMPLLALAVWVMKTKIEREIAKEDPVVDTQEKASATPEGDVQNAS